MSSFVTSISAVRTLFFSPASPQTRVSSSCPNAARACLPARASIAFPRATAPESTITGCHPLSVRCLICVKSTSKNCSESALFSSTNCEPILMTTMFDFMINPSLHRPNLSGTLNNPFIRSERLKAHWATCMQFLGGDPDFRPQTKFKPVRKTGWGVYVDCRGIHRIYELPRELIIIRDNCFGMSGGVTLHMRKACFRIRNNFYSHLKRQKFLAVRLG